MKTRDEIAELVDGILLSESHGSAVRRRRVVDFVVSTQEDAVNEERKRCKGLRAKLAKSEAYRMQAVEDRVVAERARAGAEKAAEEAVRR